MKDAVNKAARFIVHYCLRHQIGNIVFGWNDRQKDSINIGKTNNQTAVAPLGETPSGATASTLYKFRQQDLKTAFKN